MAYKCVRCGATYPDNLQDWWGRTHETVGMGTEPVCTALVVQKNLPPVPGSNPPEYPKAVCRGGLFFTTEAKATDTAALTPLDQPAPVR
jgi:hypothetical protein